MKFAPVLAIALLVAGGAGYYAYAQTQRPAAQTERSPNALERLRNWVMDQNGTERAFDNQYWDHHETVLSVEARSGEALFASTN
jgi:peptide methionine sulfoxide reductase MsrB